MKKILLSAFLMLLSLSSFAGAKDVKLVSGDASVIAVKGMSVRVEFDYSECQIYDMGEKKFFDIDEYMKFKGEDWVRDLPGELRKAEDAFLEEFNDESKKAQVVGSSAEAEYTMVFKLKEFSYGKPVVFFRSDIAWGTGVVEIVKTATKETVATFEFVKVDGAVAGGIAAMELRREQCYEHVAEAMAKTLNKIK